MEDSRYVTVFPEKPPETPVAGGKSNASSVQPCNSVIKPEKRRTTMKEILRKRTNLATFFTISAYHALPLFASKVSFSKVSRY